MTAKAIHSLDFHAGYRTIRSLQVADLSNQVNQRRGLLKLTMPAHGCIIVAADGLNGVWEHIANGMYGACCSSPNKRGTSQRILPYIQRTL